MDMMCSNGLPLFSFEDNSTFELIDRLRQFRASYEPYHGYLCTVICFFGILTNLINVVVLTKRQMRTSINVLLTGIAFCDMGTMASYLIYIIHFVLADHVCNPYLYTYGWMFFLMCHVMLSIALHTTTLWLSVAMSFIRIMTLRQARIGSHWLRSDNTWKICAIVYACVFSLCVPNVFSNGILPWPEYFNTTCSDQPETAIEYEQLYKAYTIGVPPEHCLVFTVTFWLTGTLFKIIPCILLALLIFSLLCTIRRAEKNRKALLDMNRNRAILNLTTAALGPHPPRPQNQNPHGIRSDRTTAMLLMILGLSLLTELPQGAISLLSGIYVAHMQEYVYPNVADILDLLSLINSSVNFILYCIMSSKYRQVFWQVVLPRRIYVRWFVRQRRSTHQRPRNLRRPLGPVNPSGFCPESENLCGVSELMTTRRTHRRSDFTDIYEEDKPDEDTNDLGGSLRRHQNTPTSKNNKCVFAFTVDQVNNNRLPEESVEVAPSASPHRLRSLLLPRFPSPKKRAPQPAATSTTSLASSSRIVSTGKSLHMRKKTISKTALLAARSSLAPCEQSPPSKSAERRMFPLSLFRRRDRPSDVSLASAKEERKQWLVDCSCLCKCAFKSELASTSVDVVCLPTAETAAVEVEDNIKVTELVLRKEEELENIDGDDGHRLLCSPVHNNSAGQDETVRL